MWDDMNAAPWIEELKSVEGLRNLLATHGPRLASGALLALIAIELGLALTAQPARPDLAAEPAPAPPPVRAPNRTLELATVLNAHLFGLSATTPTSAADAPLTSIPLVLAGVMAMPDPRQGMAILGENAAAARFYKVGSALPGNAVLHSVYNDRVLLERNGAVEALFLPRTLKGTSPVAFQQAPPEPNPGQRLQNLAQNNQLLGGVIRVQPVLNQGKLSGYRIFPGARGTSDIFTELGLQSGDLITAINGTVLDDPNRGNELLQTLSSASSAIVTVNRNGQPMEVNLNLETVAARAEAAAAEAAQLQRGRNAGQPDAPPAGLAGRRGGARTNGNGGVERPPSDQ